MLVSIAELGIPQIAIRLTNIFFKTKLVNCMKQRSSNLKRLSLLCMLFLGLCSLTIAQRTVTGTITDANTGEGLIGANVLVVGTSIGAATDIDGAYSIDVPAGANELEISYTGYATQIIAIETSNILDVALAEGSFLDEVVVTGYGSVKAKEVTSSITSIDSDDFNQGNINDAAQALQGKVPGLSIYNKGGNPNSESTIRLRGISTVGANVSPLVVIDGVIGSSLDNVDPSDIENISVLRDGSAAAIYGSRGSSGVILVTTKRGSRSGGVSASYNGYVSSASVANELNVFDKAAYIAAGGNDLGSDTDWQDLVTRNAITNVHNLAVSGGSGNTTFRVSTNFRNVQGVLEKSGFDQINARANLSHYALNDKLNLQFNMALTNRESNFSFNEALRYAALYNPTAPVNFSNGEFFQAVLFDNFNPVAIIEQNQNVGERKNLNFNAQASYEIAKGLTWSMNYGQQYVNNLNGEYYPNSSFFRGLNANGLARRFADDSRVTTFETYGTYDMDISGGDISFTGGYSYQEDEYSNFFVQASNFPANSLGFNALENSFDNAIASGSLSLASDASPENKIIAFFGRVNANFDDGGLNVSASLRNEGSSKLGPDNRWGTFPAVSVGVDLNKYLNVGVDNLKLRAGYGVTGSLPNESNLYDAGYQYSTTAGGTVTAVRDPNPNLKWEQKAELNLGVDFAFNDFKITGSLDFFDRTIKDFILNREIETSTSVTGASNITDNAGQLSVTGVEASISFNGIGSGDFSWTPSFVLSTSKSVLDAFPQEESTGAEVGAPGQSGIDMIRVAVGEEIGQIWGPVFTSVDSEGKPVFADLNGDGVISVAQSDALLETGDFQQLGNGLPSFELGWSNNITYKNWDVNAFFRGAFGHSLVNMFRVFYEPIDPGAINSYNRVTSDLAPAGLTSAQYSSLYVEKADFLKLDNLTLGYNIDLGDNSAFKNLRFYLSGQNLFVLTSYTGVDPEPQLQDFGPTDNGGRAGTSPNVLQPGIDRRNNYFTAKTFTFGVNVGF